MKKNILFGLITIAFIAVAMLNIGITSKGNIAVLNLQKAFRTASADAESGDSKYLVKTVMTGTATQTKMENGVQKTRTCNYTQIVCTGTGDVDCTSGFDYSNCTEWS